MIDDEKKNLPPCCQVTQGDPPAKGLYAEYNAAGENPGLNFLGQPCPTWEELPENIRTKWEAVAERVLEHYDLVSHIAQAVGDSDEAMQAPDYDPIEALRRLLQTIANESLTGLKLPSGDIVLLDVDPAGAGFQIRMDNPGEGFVIMATGQHRIGVFPTVEMPHSDDEH